MTITASTVRFEKKRTCQDCGANADHVFLADTVDRDTGQRDEIALCRSCWRKRRDRIWETQQ